MPGLIAMTSVFVVVGIEMFFASKGAGHVHSADYENLGHDESQAHLRPGHKRSNSYARYRSGSLGSIHTIRLNDFAQSSENLMAASDNNSSDPSLARTRPKEMSQDDSDSDLDLDPDELGPPDIGVQQNQSRHKASGHAHHNGAPQSVEMTEAQHKKQLLQCLLLEAGILFHSVFIGMAVSVATGTSFVVLLVAISFHQTFEGFALGSRISAIRFPASSPKPWLMALAYGTTTPIGQAIGLAIHNLYDPASQTGLLTVGLMNAISSGLLLFAGLVELLAEDFLSDESYVTLRGKRRLQACASVVGGAALMALVGAWA